MPYTEYSGLTPKQFNRIFPTGIPISLWVEIKPVLNNFPPFLTNASKRLVEMKNKYLEDIELRDKEL